MSRPGSGGRRTAEDQTGPKQAEAIRTNLVLSHKPKLPSKEVPTCVSLLGTKIQIASGVVSSEFPGRDLARAGQGSQTAALQLDKVCRHKTGHLGKGAKWCQADGQHPWTPTDLFWPKWVGSRKTEPPSQT